MWNRTAKASIQTSVLVSPELYNLAKVNNIKLSEAMRVGLAMMFAERGIAEYDNSLNLYRKTMELKKRLAEELQKVSELQEQLNKITQL